MYLIHILVAHTTHKSLLNSIHMIVCQLIWPSLIAYELMCKYKFLFLVGNLKKNLFRSLKSLFLTSWLVLIFAFKRHHVFKTFLDHIHWVLKTSLQVVFLHKIFRFQSFKNFNCFDQSKISLDWLKMWAFVFKTLCLFDRYSIDVRSIKTRNFSIFKFLTDQSFHALHI